MEKKIIENGSKNLYKFMRRYKPSLFESGIGQRLPAEYKKFYKEWKEETPKPVHYIPEPGTWKRNEETGEISRIENVPLPAFPAKELHQVITGGEEVILGFQEKGKYAPNIPKFWMPIIYRSVVYSEILDKYLSVLITSSVIKLIHEHRGFDNYLLQNRACDLKTLVTLKLKRLLFFTLFYKKLPYDKNKNQEILEKYEKYLIPENEMHWYGLSFTEACRKQEKIEKKLKQDSIIPLKHIYRAYLIQELESNKNSSVTEKK